MFLASILASQESSFAASDILAKDSIVESGVPTDVHDIWVGTMLQKKSHTLLFLAFYGMSVLRQETECKF